MSHSKLPWTCELSDSMADDEDAWLVLSEEGDVAEITSPAHTAEADAALIVRAVNSFDDLLAACKAAIKDSEMIPGKVYYGPGRELKLATLDMIRAAIAKAEKGT